jgi:hypothetical protein
MKPEKALSVKQPWAWLICMGYKDIENRDWFIGRKVASGAVDFTLKLPTRIYVHAGKQPDYSWNGEDLIKKNLTETQYSNYRYLSEHFTLGAIIGEVDITGCVDKSNSPWFVGKYGFVLRNPVLYQTPFPCRGALGFFTPDIEVKP